MIRILAASAVIVLSLAAAPSPVAAYSLRHLEPGERAQMLTACRRLHRGTDRDLCHRIVDDQALIANDKRSCLWAMTALMQGSAWAKVKSLPATLTCTVGLRRAGYPVSAVLRRLED